MGKRKKEVWRKAAGYEGLYMVSSRARIKRLTRIVRSGNNAKRVLPEMILKPFWGEKNQLCIFLTKDHEYKINMVYRLMCQSFKKNPLNKPTVNHKDGNRRNNSLDNLEWATWSENNGHAVRMGLSNPTPNLPKNHKKVALYTLGDKIVKKFMSGTDAARWLGCAPQTVLEVCNNKGSHKTAYGYKCKFI